MNDQPRWREASQPDDQTNETVSHAGETQTLAKLGTTSHPHQMQLKGRGATTDQPKPEPQPSAQPTPDSNPKRPLHQTKPSNPQSKD